MPGRAEDGGLGYDGKGQHRDRPIADAEPRLGPRSATRRRSSKLRRLRARGLGGRRARARRRLRPLRRRSRTRTRNHILDVSWRRRASPAPVAAEAGRDHARAILEELDVVGVLCVEFFLTRDGRLLVNELAPRPHNSGHLTFDACVTSQFEQQVRAVCGLPLGVDRAAAAGGDGQPAGRPLGRRRAATGPPRWPPDVKLHLYGKTRAAARPQDGPPHGPRRHARRGNRKSARGTVTSLV